MPWNPKDNGTPRVNQPHTVYRSPDRIAPAAPHTWLKMNRQTTPGYSGTPLARKLGIKESTRLHAINAPDGYEELLAPLPPDVTFDPDAGRATDIVHLFVRDRELLASHLGGLRSQLRADAVLWVSWPKKSSGVPTTITEDTIRELALPLGWVDVKVCAVTEIWSGLKLVVRKELRAR